MIRYQEHGGVPGIALADPTRAAGWGLRKTIVLAVILAMASTGSIAEEPSIDVARQAELHQKEKFWKGIAHSEPSGKTVSRQILGYALALAEARQRPERLSRLLDLLAQMQDRNAQSKTYGNLRWKWQDAGVNDPNAVEFCMHDALLLWVRHRQWIPAPARQQLWAVMQYGVEGVLRHRVPTTYTNIAMTRTANLIVLGEVLGRKDVADEGRRRLDDLVAWTASYGTHEFVSPTYYGIDLNALTLIATHAQDGRARRQADALLRLLWTDIALNWFPASGRLGGTYSRTYDYLSGLGALDWYTWVNGWFSAPTPGKAERVEPYGNQWPPPAGLRDLSRQRLPRLVRQSWGERLGQSRTYMAYRDIGLSTLGASYGAEDVPLAIDLPGSRAEPRGYFIADGRQDPYGKNKHPSGTGRQLKATHLKPFWIGAQRTSDALAAAIYEANPGQTNDVQSHLVLRRNAQAIVINGAPVQFAHNGSPTTVPVRLGQPVVFRYGTAAVGVRLLMATMRGGHTAQAALVDDGNSYGCVRLTIDHASSTSSDARETSFPSAAVVLWVRVGTQLHDDNAFEAWRKAFEASQPARVSITANGIEAEVPGSEGPVGVSVRIADGRQPLARQIVPAPSRGVLELDGKEIGRPMLDVVGGK